MPASKKKARKKAGKAQASAAIPAPEQALPEIQYLPLTKLKPHPHNPRRISRQALQQLMNSIQANTDYFAARPILLSDRTGELIIIGGHKRSLAAKRLKMKQAPTITMHGLTEAREREIIIRDNIMQGEWDYVELAQEHWGSYPLEEWGLIITNDEAPQTTTGEDNYTEPNDPHKTIKTKIKAGDLIQIGPHRLLCGDSTKADDVNKLLGKATPALMVTDPPYGVNYDANWRNEVTLKTGKKKGQKIGASAIAKVANDDNYDWTETYKLSPCQVAYIWHAGVYAAELSKNIQAAEFNIRAQIIWGKNRHSMGRGHYHWQHEPCWYAVRKGSNAQWIGDHSQTTLWKIDKPMKSETGHSTQKPIECMARPIRNHNGDVYDPFMGSGTTMVAAHQLNRTCYGIEIDPIYCQIIVNRMKALDPKLKVKINGKAI